MKNAILVSSDPHWRVVMEGTLLGRGWSVASVESLSKGDAPSGKDVQAILIDSVSISVDAVTPGVATARLVYE